MTNVLDILVAEDLHSAELRLGDARHTLTAEALDRLIVDLANARLSLTPAVPDHPVEGEARAVANPTVYVLPNATEGAHALVLRHPGLGWLHFLFTTDGAVDVVNALSAAVIPQVHQQLQSPQ